MSDKNLKERVWKVCSVQTVTYLCIPVVYFLKFGFQR